MSLANIRRVRHPSHPLHLTRQQPPRPTFSTGQWCFCVSISTGLRTESLELKHYDFINNPSPLDIPRKTVEKRWPLKDTLAGVFVQYLETTGCLKTNDGRLLAWSLLLCTGRWFIRHYPRGEFLVVAYLGSGGIDHHHSIVIKWWIIQLTHPLQRGKTFGRGGTVSNNDEGEVA